MSHPSNDHFNESAREARDEMEAHKREARRALQNVRAINQMLLMMRIKRQSPRKTASV